MIVTMLLVGGVPTAGVVASVDDIVVAPVAKSRDIVDADEAAFRSQSMTNVRQLALAIYDYIDIHKHFPPAVVLGPDAKTPHSWRIEILPYLHVGGKELYDRYKLNEPWDSENNKRVLLQMPAVFRSPKDNEKSFHTSYFAVTGPQTMFADEKGTRFEQVTDGLACTIMLVETKADVPWTKPEDVVVDAGKDLPKLGGWAIGGFIVGIANGDAKFISDVTHEEFLRKAFYKADGESLEFR
jgi:hypothetical protein